MSSDYCPRCSGVLLMTTGTPDMYRAQCQKCRKVWELDDDLNPITVSGWWLAVAVVLFLLAALVEVPH